MKRILCFALGLILLSVSFVSCSGYNKIMRNHLKNADSYRTCEVYLKDFYVIDPSSNEKKRDLAELASTDAVIDTDIVLEVTCLDDPEVLLPFLGYLPNESTPLESYTLQFRLTSDNGSLLLSNHFFSDVTRGEAIRVRVSDFIYMDSEFFYVAALEYNGKEYLSFEEGLGNIVRMMDENKSAF